jgi:hypothetical protein
VIKKAAFILILIAAAGANPVFAGETPIPRIFVNGGEITDYGAGAKPYFHSPGIIMAPARPVAEAWGCRVEWDGAKKRALVSKGGEAFATDPNDFECGRAYIQLTFMEGFGAAIRYDGEKAFLEPAGPPEIPKTAAEWEAPDKREDGGLIRPDCAEPLYQEFFDDMEVMWDYKNVPYLVCAKAGKLRTPLPENTDFRAEISMRRLDGTDVEPGEPAPKESAGYIRIDFELVSPSGEPAADLIWFAWIYPNDHAASVIYKRGQNGYDAAYGYPKCVPFDDSKILGNR